MSIKDIEVVKRDNREYWVVLEGWGFTKKAIFSLANIKHKDGELSFTPACEINVFSQNPVAARLPFAKIFFKSSSIANKQYGEIIYVIKENGVEGIADYIRKIDVSNLNEFGSIYLDWV